MSDMRTALSEAIDSHNAGEDIEESQQEILTDETDYGDESTGAEGQDSAPSDESEGAEADGDAISAESDPEAKAPSDPKPEGDKTAAKDGKDPSANQSLKAPVGWKPAEREQWSKVPRQVQERIIAREKEMNENIANTREARDVNDYVNKMGEHYKPLLQQGGFGHPLDAAGAAMQSMSTLSQGSPQQKAAEAARIINQFGIDIEELDNALVGGTNAQGERVDPQTSKIERMLEERLAPVNQLMQQAQNLQRQQQQQKSTQAMTAVQKFAENAEFLNDVREDMADIIEISSKRGVDLTLQQAYDRACAAHPDVSEIMAQRRREDEIKGGRQSLSAKRNAASSVSGRRVGSGAPDESMSLRDQIASAMDSREV